MNTIIPKLLPAVFSPSLPFWEAPLFVAAPGETDISPPELRFGDLLNPIRIHVGPPPLSWILRPPAPPPFAVRAHIASWSTVAEKYFKKTRVISGIPAA